MSADDPLDPLPALEVVLLIEQCGGWQLAEICVLYNHTTCWHSIYSEGSVRSIIRNVSLHGAIVTGVRTKS